MQVNLEDLSIEEALQVLSDSSGYYFAYLYDIPDQLNKGGLRKYRGYKLEQILDELTGDTEIEYFLVRDQVILRNRKPEKAPEYLKGQITNDSDGGAIPYSTIELKGRNKGAVSDYKARFKLNLESVRKGDTLFVSAVGFEKKEIAVGAIDISDSLMIRLKEKIYAIPQVEVVGSYYTDKVVGEDASKSQGEMYMDTHGQQAALFIDNEDEVRGKIEKLRFFLSPKGNTHAPFRVRLYDLDTVSGLPGRDLIPHFLVVKPDVIRGWYEVDVFEYDIDIPEKGYFVAMEGVFPNDTELIINDIDYKKLKKGGVRKKKDLIIRVLSYGQRIGFRKSGKNLTWHYSLSGRWFQLPRQSYNVMMGARLLIDKEKSE